MPYSLLHVQVSVAREATRRTTSENSALFPASGKNTKKEMKQKRVVERCAPEDFEMDKRFFCAFTMNSAFSPSPAQCLVHPSEKEVIVERARGNVALHLTPDLKVELVHDLELSITGDR